MSQTMNNTPLPYRTVARILRRNGFRPIPKSGSSHEKWVRVDGENLVVRMNGMNRMIWRRLVKEHNLQDVEGTDGRKYY